MSTFIEQSKTNRRTSIAGLVTSAVSIIGIVGNFIIQPLLLGDPVQWIELLHRDNIALVATFFVGVGLLFARDQDRSSQDTGIRASAPLDDLDDAVDQAIAARFGEEHQG